jgi:hypothetical protein
MNRSRSRRIFKRLFYHKEKIAQPQKMYLYDRIFKRLFYYKEKIAQPQKMDYVNNT